MYSDISERIQHHRKHIGELSVSMNSTIDLAENFEKYELPDQVEDQRNAMKTFYVIEQDLLDRISILEKVLHGTISGTETVSLSEMVQNECGKLQKKRKPDQYKTHPKYMELEKRVFAVNHPDEILSGEEEEGLLIVSTQVETKCPLTKDTYEHPMKNKRCGHVFEKDAILEMINRNAQRHKKTKCPISGCGRTVSKRDLVRDIEMEQAVQLANREELASQREVDEDVVRL